MQPPSGGCVLKHHDLTKYAIWSEAAAFGRLCVETMEDALLRAAAKSSRLRAAVC